MNELIDIHVNIPREVSKKLDTISRRHGATKTFHITRALEAYIRLWERNFGKIRVQSK